MSAPDRQASIIGAAIPILRTAGAAATTKEIAAAAGIAEGTLFRVFPSKDDLILACVKAAFDTAEVVDQLGAIDRDQPLEHRLVAAVEVMTTYLRGVISLMSVLHHSGATLPQPPKGKRPGRSPEIEAAFVDIIGADADQLRFPAERVTAYLSMLTLANAHPMLPETGATSADVVDVLLHGALRNPLES